MKRSYTYPFMARLGQIINSHQANAVLLTGNIDDLFFVPDEGDSIGEYVPLDKYLVERWDRAEGRIIITYKPYQPIRFVSKEDRTLFEKAWLQWAGGRAKGSQEFSVRLAKAAKNPEDALELLRAMCTCSRGCNEQGQLVLPKALLILIEDAHFLLPATEMSRLFEPDRRRVITCRDWFADPAFTNGGDTVVMISELRSKINADVLRIPTIMNVAIPTPDISSHRHVISWFNRGLPDAMELRLWSSQTKLAEHCAGLSTAATLQLLRESVHSGQKLRAKDVSDKVEEFIQASLGAEDVVGFLRPEHTLKDVIGTSQLKKYVSKEFIPRIQRTGTGALTGAVLCGPIGSGKSFLAQAIAAECHLPVLILKNFRSSKFGGTDILIERLRRVLDALHAAVVYIEEADLQFGGVGKDVHPTERRATAAFQKMMSDPKWRGRIFWMLDTARIHQLSPDLRRVGRAGSLILPILDPSEADRKDFLNWMLKPVLPSGEKFSPEEMDRIEAATTGYYAAAYAGLRDELVAKAGRDGTLTVDEILAAIEDQILPNVGLTREYQSLQAMLACTRQSLLPEPSTPEKRLAWEARIQELEILGIR